MEQGPGVLAAAIGGAADDVDVTLGGPAADAIAAVADAVAAEERRPLALLGECTLAPGVAAGLQRRHDDIALVWLDAHGDLNTPATSPSGFLGGMPFAILLGWCHDELRPGAPLPVERAALVGARDLDPGEIEAIDRTGVDSRRRGSAGGAARGRAAVGAPRRRRARSGRRPRGRLPGARRLVGGAAGRRVRGARRHRPGGGGLGLLRESGRGSGRDRRAPLRRCGARAASVALRS
jgi:Arginase family